MSHQVRFRTLPADLVLIESAILERGGCLLAYYHPSNVPRVVLTIGATEASEPMIYATLPELVPDVRMKAVESQGYFVIDHTDSPVLEIVRAFQPDAPSPRRQFYADGRWVGGEWTPFDERFSRFAKSLMGWLKRSFVCLPEDQSYFGPAVQRLSHGKGN